MSNHSENIYTVKPTQTESNSTSASFCTVLGIIVLIGGLIVAVMTANTGYRFDFTVFLVTLIPYVVAGCMMFCVSELFQNIKSIATSLKELSIYGDSVRTQYLAGGIRTEMSTGAKVDLNNGTSKPATLPASDSKAGQRIMDTVTEENRDWVEVSELGKLGERLVAMGVCRKETIYAPDGTSDAQARSIGFSSWTLEDGKPRYWTMKNYVPKLTEKELEELLTEDAR